MSPVTCPGCGKQVSQGTTVCPSCGAAIAGSGGDAEHRAARQSRLHAVFSLATTVVGAFLVSAASYDPAAADSPSGKIGMALLVAGVLWFVVTRVKARGRRG